MLPVTSLRSQSLGLLVCPYFAWGLQYHSFLLVGTLMDTWPAWGSRGAVKTRGNGLWTTCNWVKMAKHARVLQIELSEPESALPLTKSLWDSQGILNNVLTCSSSLPTPCPRIPGGKDLGETPKVKTARTQDCTAQVWMFTGPDWKNLRGEFTGKRLRGREWKQTDTVAVRYQLLPLGLHFFQSTKPERRVQGRRGRARHYTKNQRKGSATKSKLNPQNTWGRTCFWGKFQLHLSGPTTIIALPEQTSWGSKSAPSLDAWGLFPLSLTLQV